MHTLIVCGTPWCNLQSVNSLLQQAGMAAPLAADSGSIRSMPDWHERLFARRLEPTAAIEPGKPWELAAGEIFLANWSQATWALTTAVPG